MGHIFISYASADRDLCDLVENWLTSHGYSPWSDRRLSGGEMFRPAIQEALSNAQCAIVIWTANSIVSDFVPDEAQEAQRAKRLIPIAPDDLDIQSIPLGFRGLQTLRLGKLDQLSIALTRFGIEPSSKGKRPAAATGGRERPAGQTIGAIIRRMEKVRNMRIAVGAVTVPLAVVLLIAFPSAMLATLSTIAVVVIVMLFLR